MSEEARLLFDGSSGRRPSAEARRHVYRMLRLALRTDTEDPDGWLLGGVENAADVRRILRAAKAVYAELGRKGRLKEPVPAPGMPPEGAGASGDRGEPPPVAQRPGKGPRRRSNDHRR